MRILVVAEHDGKAVRRASLAALAFARSVSDETRGSVEWLLLGVELQSVAQSAARFAPVLIADNALLADPIAERHGPIIANVVRQRQADMLVGAATTYGKDVVTRAAGLLGGAMAGDVVRHEWKDGELRLQRPTFAGGVLTTVRLIGSPRVVTIRPSAYSPAVESGAEHEMTTFPVDESSLPQSTQYEGVVSRATGRPDATEARVVVSGGRAFATAEEFEQYVGGLADQLGGATGSTRALVDAGITPNELQIGQTGKVVAPDLYFALGVSGAVQHLAGMKNARVIVSINKDPDAPILQVSNYALIGDVRTVVPQLIERLRQLRG